MPVRFTTRRFVQFADTDMAGIVHFTNYLKYLEEAEHEFLREHGLCVVMYDERGSYGFPKLSAECHFRRPVRCETWLQIELEVSTPDLKTIQYVGRITDSEGTLVAEGKLKVACCRFPAEGFPFPIPLPDHVLEILAVSPTP